MRLFARLLWSLVCVCQDPREAPVISGGTWIRNMTVELDQIAVFLRVDVFKKVPGFVPAVPGSSLENSKFQGGTIR